MVKMNRTKVVEEEILITDDIYTQAKNRAVQIYEENLLDGAYSEEDDAEECIKDIIYDLLYEYADEHLLFEPRDQRIVNISLSEV